MEFVDYKVVLQLKDGTETQGLISHVDSSRIVLGTKTFENSLVKDVKVVQLPDGKRKRKPAAKEMAHSVLKLTLRAATPKPRKTEEFGSDVLEIKAYQDFDFAANLAMFDKKSVFADFLRNDTVSARDRLVGHNKVEQAKPKSLQDKYSNDEMVLAQDKTDSWNSIGLLSLRLVSPGPGPAAQAPKTKDAQYSFKFAGLGGQVPLASPVQLLEVESAAQESCGVPLLSLVEVGACHLAKLVVTKILGGSVRLSNRKNHNLPPLVLLLIGGGQCSRRTFALGRHLANRGIRVLAYVPNEEAVEEETLRECQVFEKCGGKVVGSSFAGLLDILHNQLETPVELIVDALQGFTSLLADLFYTSDSMTKLKELIHWTNEPRQREKIMSLEISLGIDGGLGTVLDGACVVQSKYIVSLGLPVSGLIHAYNNGTLTENATHYVVDIGIPNTVYLSKPHLRKFDKFWFCAEEYLELEISV